MSTTSSVLTFLVDAAARATVCLAAGALVSVLLWQRPAKAHLVLLLSFVAALVMPVVSHVAVSSGWGLLPATQPASMLATSAPVTATRGLDVNEHVRTDAAGVPAVERSDAPSNVIAQSPGGPSAWHFAILCAWVTLSIGVLARVAIAFRLGSRLVARARRLAPGPIPDLVRKAAIRFGLPRCPEVVESDEVPSPAIWCWGRRPIILLPSQWRGDFEPGDWFGILAHEVAHARRRDHVAGLCARATACFLPWHPLVYWLERRLARLAEFTCDDEVRRLDIEPVSYAGALVRLAPVRRAGILHANAGSRSALLCRVRRLLDGRCASSAPTRRWAVIAGALVAVAMAAVALVRHRTPESGGEGRVIDTATVAGAPAVVGAVELHRNPSIGGVVRDDAGDPVAGATVVIGLQDRGAEVTTVHFEGARTDALGTWRLKGIPATSTAIWLSVHHQDHAPLVTDPRSKPFMDVLWALSDVRVLRRGLPVTGSVVDERGRPVRGARVVRSDLPAPIWKNLEGRGVAVETDVEGRFRIGAPYDGVLELLVTAPGRAPTLERVRVTEKVPEVTVLLEPASTVRGRVVTDAGGGVANARIRASSWRGSTALEWEVWTGAKGRFVWTDAPADVVMVEIRKPGFRTVQEWPLYPSPEEHVIRFAEERSGTPSSASHESRTTSGSAQTGRTTAWGLGGAGHRRGSRVEPAAIARDGRSVVGRVDGPPNRVRASWKSGSARLVRVGAGSDEAKGSRIRASFGASGAFRIDGVEPGNYRLAVSVFDPVPGVQGLVLPLTTVSRELVVPPPTGTADPPIDAGTLSIDFEVPSPGDPAPHFEVTTLDGRVVRSRELAGSALLLDFWIAACRDRHCAQLKALHAVYGGQGLVIVSLNADADSAIARREAPAQLAGWEHAAIGSWERASLIARYRLPCLPYTVLIAPDRRIVARGLHGERLLAAVDGAVRRSRRR